MTETLDRWRPVTERPWAALLALCVGFFMILVDMTIVVVAQPQIMADLDTDVNGIVWVTSSYLLTYAVPLLITGRLGDKYGPRRIYQIGLVIFTIASVWCGLAESVGELVAARGLQGFGAALITPQTMALITRIFPPAKRGAAMGVWGTVAGVATLLGPLLGGILTDAFGWEWIFFVNLPVGLAGLVLAARLVPAVETHEHRFDLIGVGLSAVGMSALVFGIQEGEKHHWNVWVWSLIGFGVLMLLVFLRWQARIRTEPLVPLTLFADRNFSLANVGITSVGFAVNALMIPTMFYLQLVGGMTPTRAALMLVPQAVLTGILAPLVGRLLDRVNPRTIVAPALALYAVSIGWFAVIATPQTPVWQLLIPLSLTGLAAAGIWSPLAATATRNLPWHQAGAGSGVYNTTRMIGSVLGAAVVSALMQTRLADELPGTDTGALGRAVGRLPEEARDGFAAAMSQTLFLPAAVLLLGVAAAMFLAPTRPAGPGRTPSPAPVSTEPAGHPDLP